MYTLTSAPAHQRTSAPAPSMPTYSSAAVITGSIIFLALLTCAITASIFARHRRSARPMTGGQVRKDHRMTLMPHSRDSEGATVAAGAVLGVIGLARELRSRHAAEELERETVEVWFDAPNLADFPAQELDEMLPGIARGERPRLQTAWLLAAHGHDAAWLTGHLGLSSDVARLLEDSAQRSNTPPRSRPDVPAARH